MKRFLAVLGICIVLAVPLVLCVSAESTLTFSVSIRDNPDGTSQGDILKVKFRYSNNGVEYDAGPYSDGASSVLIGDFFRLLTIQSSVANTYGYTGAFVNVYNDSYDVTGVILDMVTEYGRFYVPFDTPVLLNNTYNGEPLVFSFVAVNYPEFVDSQVGYQAGYEIGKKEGFNNCYDNYYLPLLDQYNTLQQTVGGATAEQLEAARLEGFRQGSNAVDSSKKVVENVIVNTIDATGGVLVDLLNLQFFGVPIFYILAVAFLVPAIIFAIKLFQHKG